MADAAPTSFQKQITIRDAETTITTTGTVTLEGVLTTDNTDAYTPTLQYHPATKLYVDDASGLSGGVYNVEDYGAVGYDEDPGTGRTYSDTGIAAAIAAVKASGRGGVVQFKNLTYYIEDELLVEAVPGIEFRGPGGHYQMENTTEVGEIATVRCLDNTKNVFRIKAPVSNVEDSSIKFSSLVIRGSAYAGGYSGETAGIFFDDSSSWMTCLTINNCWISDKVYGIRNNFTGDIEGVGVWNISESRITGCFWGVRIALGGTTTVRFHHNEIRANGHSSTAEADYDATAMGGGVWFYGLQGGELSHNSFESNSTGIRLRTSRGTDTSHNHFENNRTCAINLQGCYGIDASNHYSHCQDTDDNADLFRIISCETIDFSGSASTHSGVTPYNVTMPNVVDSGSNTSIQKTYSTQTTIGTIDNIQAAITAKETVQLESGDYELDATIDISNVVGGIIRGSGRGKVLPIGNALRGSQTNLIADSLGVDPIIEYQGTNWSIDELGIWGADYTGTVTTNVATHTGATNNTVLTAVDAENWTTDQFVGMILYNVTDGSYGTVAGNNAGTVTVDDLTGGTSNDFVANDVCHIKAAVGLLMKKGTGVGTGKLNMRNCMFGWLATGIKLGDALTDTNCDLSHFIDCQYDQVDVCVISYQSFVVGCRWTNTILTDVGTFLKVVGGGKHIIDGLYTGTASAIVLHIAPDYNRDVSVGNNYFALRDVFVDSAGSNTQIVLVDEEPGPLTGTHDGDAASEFLEDSGNTWQVNVFNDRVLTNTTNSETTTVTANTADTVTGVLSGGESWDVGDGWSLPTADPPLVIVCDGGHFAAASYTGPAWTINERTFLTVTNWHYLQDDMFRWIKGTYTTRYSIINITNCRFAGAPEDLFDVAGSTGKCIVHVTNCVDTSDTAHPDYHAFITGGGSAVLLDSATSARLKLLSDPVNFVGKKVGKMVWDTDLVQPVYAAGAATNSHWHLADNTDTHTPV